MFWPMSRYSSLESVRFCLDFFSSLPLIQVALSGYVAGEYVLIGSGNGSIAESNLGQATDITVLPCFFGTNLTQVIFISF